MKKIFFRCLVAVLAASMVLWAVPVSAGKDIPAGSNNTFTFSAGDYTIAKNDAGQDIIQMTGFSPNISPGDPMLPHKVFNILVPPDIIWSSLSFNVVSADTVVLDGTYDIAPSPPLMPNDDGSGTEFWGVQKQIVDGRNLAVYSQDTDYPDNTINNLPYSQMGKWKYTTFDFSPFQYNPVSQKLTLTGSLTLEISYNRSGEMPLISFMRSQLMDLAAPELFFNYSSISGLYRSVSNLAAPQVTYDYVIITTNAIQTNSAKLADFIAHKQSQGHSVLVATENDWGGLTGQAPNHKAEKIRQWLINNYLTYGVQYVLIIGNPIPYENGEGDVPMKMCYPDRTSQYPDTPTDHFYADLTGNWDLDGDGYYGESTGDMGAGGVDIAPEVIVGRIPVYGADYTTLNNILQKTIDYENETDIAWRKNALLPMAFSDVDTDGAELSEDMKTDYLNAAGYSTWTMYMQDSTSCGFTADSVYASNEELRAGTYVRDRWAANDFGLVTWWAHGNYNIAAVCPTGGNLFVTDYCSSLDNSHPSFTYQCSCLNGQPEASTNLQYAILKNGGIGTVSATRVSWYYIGQTNFFHSPSNSGIGYEYVKRLVAGEAAGNALYATMQNVGLDLTYYPWAMNCFGFNLYGDPTTSLTSHADLPLSIVTSSLPDGNKDSLYSQPLQATGGTGQYTWSISSGSLPVGLTLAPSGVISGTPTTLGTSSFTVQVNDGSTSVTKDLSIDINAGPQKLIGSDDVSPDGPITANFISMSRFQATQSGNIISFRVRATGIGNVKVAIYADSGGEPGPRLGYNDSPQAVVAGWNSLSIPSTSITSGNYYWLAINSDTSVAAAHMGSGLVRYKAATFSGFGWPDPAGSGYGSATTCYGMLSGWGTMGP